jgi:hypothetical protein
VAGTVVAARNNPTTAVVVVAVEEQDGVVRPIVNAILPHRSVDRFMCKVEPVEVVAISLLVVAEAVVLMMAPLVVSVRCLRLHHHLGRGLDRPMATMN